MGVFLLGSGFSVTAVNSVMFIMGRAIAGIGAGGTFSGTLTIIVYTVSPHRRAAYTGSIGGLFGVHLRLEDK